jgi:hypothetical protein
MANNLNIKDGNSLAKIVKTTEIGGVHIPHHITEVSPNSSAYDAFGRLRVSEVTTQVDAKQTNDALPFFFDTVTNGTGLSTHSVPLASSLLTTAASGDYVIRQSKQRFNYQSGKSQQIFMTFANFQAQTNITKRVGYFSSSTVAPYTASLDGIFLENDGSDVYIKIYRSGTEIDSIIQTAWNVDPMDGTGPSGIDIDWSQSQILMISFEWLGVGTAFFSFVIDGQVFLVHKANHANLTDQVYMSSPNQPLRYEIRQTAAGSGSLRQICATVGSEGSLNKLGTILSRNTGATGIDLASTATKYAIMGIRLQAAKVGTMVDIINMDIFESANKNLLWELWLSPTVSGSFTYTDVPNDAISFARGDNTQTVSGGTLLDSGFVAARTNVSPVIENAVRLGMSIAGTLDTFVLSVTPLQANATVYSSISWRSVN